MSYQKWNIRTFEKFHNNETLFVEEVLKFFFDEIDYLYAESLKYIFKRKDKYYCLKDDDSEYDTPLNYYTDFIQYYKHSVMFGLYNKLKLRCMDNKRDSSSSSSEKKKRKNSKGKSKETTSSSSNQVNANKVNDSFINTLSHLNDNTVNLNNKDNHKINNKKINSDNTTNIKIVYNNSFNSDPNSNIQDLINNLTIGLSYLDTSNPQNLIDVLKKVIIVTDLEGKCDIITKVGLTKNVYIRYLEVFYFKSNSDSNLYNLFDFIIKHEQHFIHQDIAKKYIIKERRLENIFKSLKDEIDYIDNMILFLWDKCLHKKKTNTNGVSFKYVINTNKLRKVIEAHKDDGILISFILILDYKSDIDFSKKISAFIDAHSKLFYTDYENNKKDCILIIKKDQKK